MEVLSITLFIVFLILGLIHFNWARGGKWGLDNALPTNVERERLFTPSSRDSLIVGMGLLLFSIFYLSQTRLTDLEFPVWTYKYGGWIIPSIFILRAIGDFKYVGIFKEIRNTDFGRYDSKLYIPLCLILALMGYWICILEL